MPGRVSHRSGSTANISKKDGTAVITKQRVVHTYSRVCPRQPVNKHHFLTPNTPLLEEWELPSHMLRGSRSSSRLLSGVSTQSQLNTNHPLATEPEQVKSSESAGEGTGTVPKRPKWDSNTNSGSKSVADGGHKKTRQRKGRKGRRRKPPCTNANQRGGKQLQVTENISKPSTSEGTSIVGISTVVSNQVHFQSMKDRDAAPSCNLDPVSMELTCQTVVEAGKQSTQHLPSSAIGGKSSFTPQSNTASLETSHSSACCLESTSRKVKYFMETIAADMKQAERAIPHIEKTKSNKNKNANCAVSSPPTHHYPPGNSVSNTQEDRDSEDEIEVPRARDPCGEFEDAMMMASHLPEKAPLEFSMSEYHHLTGRQVDHTILECIDDEELEGQAHTHDKKKVPVLQNAGRSEGTKQPGYTKQLPKMSAQEGGKAEKSSCSSLDEHFSGLQMTPIASLISLSNKPEDKVLAPLTSTPVTALGCANHTTPKSLCGPVNIESSPDLKQPTSAMRIFKQGPFTCSTPIHPLHNVGSRTRVHGNVKRVNTPADSWVGSTMEKMLEFDEIGFEVSQVLEADTSVGKAGTRKQSGFGFSKLFSHSTTGSQLASNGKKSDVHKRIIGKGSCNVRMKGKAQHKQPPVGSKAATKKPKRVKKEKKSKKISAKPVTESKSVVVLNQSSREHTQSVKKQKRVVPKSLKRQSRKNHSVNIRGSSFKKKLSTSSVTATDYGDPATDMDSYPLCVLTQLSVGACSSSSQTNPSAYIDTSVPEDILVQPS